MAPGMQGSHRTSWTGSTKPPPPRTTKPDTDFYHHYHHAAHVAITQLSKHKLISASEITAYRFFMWVALHRRRIGDVSYLSPFTDLIFTRAGQDFDERFTVGADGGDVLRLSKEETLGIVMLAEEMKLSLDILRLIAISSEVGHVEKARVSGEVIRLGKLAWEAARLRGSLWVAQEDERTVEAADVFLRGLEWEVSPAVKAMTYFGAVAEMCDTE